MSSFEFVAISNIPIDNLINPIRKTAQPKKNEARDRPRPNADMKVDGDFTQASHHQRKPTELNGTMISVVPAEITSTLGSVVFKRVLTLIHYPKCMSNNGKWGY